MSCGADESCMGQRAAGVVVMPGTVTPSQQIPCPSEPPAPCPVPPHTLPSFSGPVGRWQMPRGQRLGNSLEVGLACWALPSSPRETHAGPAPVPGGETQGAETCAKPSWNRPTRRCANCLDAACYMSAGFCAGCRVIVWPRVADHFYSQRGFLLENAAGTQAWTPRRFPFLRSFFPPACSPECKFLKSKTQRL